jgi:glycerol-1-phosphatase
MPTVGTQSLAASTRALCEQFDVALLDLDGVLYVGPDAVPGAPDALRTARHRGMRLAFVTNNAARPPVVVAAHLTRLEIPAAPEEVITSSQAAARYLADRLPPHSRVLVVGTEGLIDALAERGLVPVFGADDDPVAVVQGYSPTLDWAQLAEGCIAIRRGLPWVATNLDPTVPSPRGPLPGNGALVAALRHATGVEPVATGKPDPTMHRETMLRTGAKRPLVVGDRLDTDIEGAAAVGCPSLLVLTGVAGPADVIAAPAGQRPDFVGRDVTALLETHPATAVAGHQHSCRGWVAERVADTIRLTGPDVTAEETDGLDPLRALCSAVWTAVDAEPGLNCRLVGGDEPGVRALEALNSSSR